MRPETAELIMVLKGRTDLTENVPDNPNLSVYLHLAALYLSDWSDSSYMEVVRDMPAIKRAIREAVADYLSTCSEPATFIRDYFESQRRDECDTYVSWCVALVMTRVRDKNGKYINGFTADNVKPYKRVRPFVFEWEGRYGNRKK